MEQGPRELLEDLVGGRCYCYYPNALTNDLLTAALNLNTIPFEAFSIGVASKLVLILAPLSRRLFALPPYGF